MNIANGSWFSVITIASPSRLFRRPISPKSTHSGTSSVTYGTIRMAMTSRNSVSRPQNRNRAKAYPPRIDSTSVKTTVSAETTELFHRYLSKPAS